MRDHDAADPRGALGVRSLLNGRLALDYFSRRLGRRSRMIRLDGQWYDRRALASYLRRRARAGQRPVVPHSGAAIPDRVVRDVAARAWCC